MKIAIIGYGKMGHAIERIARERGHEIVCIIDENNPEAWDSEAFRCAEAAIEFTMPAVAAANYRRAFEAGVPVVSGTTGWAESMPEIKSMCDRGQGTLLWASNFSVGVNVFWMVNRYLAKIMNGLPQYTPDIREVHHIHKLDHPSGTAITTAEQIIESVGREKSWAETDTPAEGEIKIACSREGEVVGIHDVTWRSAVDEITIGHNAFSRDGFALGAVMAAEWLNGRSGWHTMDEVMQSLIK